MLKKDAAKYFGGKRKAGAEVAVSAATFSQWGDVIPEFYARRYHEVTRGKLKYKPIEYPWLEEYKAKQ